MAGLTKDANPAQVKDNKELINICKILNFNSKVDNLDTSKLQYGHLMIMMDQNYDGSHIKGLLINYFDYFYPSLLTVDDFMQEFITSIVKAIPKNQQQKYDERQLIDLTFNKKKDDDCKGSKLIHLSMADNIRSIPSMVDGLKPGQCKVVYGCFLWPDAEVKVATVTSSIIKKVAYHHGDQSLASTIIGLAQNFVGANNVNLLAPLAQFSSFTQGGKDAGAMCYISTCLKCDGIDVVSNLWQLMQGESPIPMLPWYLGFTSDIEPSGHNHYTVCGRITKIDDWHFEIMKLLIGVWIQAYNAMMDDWHFNSGMIKDYEKHHSDLGVSYIVQVSEASTANLEKEDLYAKFKLTDFTSTSNLVCFDKSGRIKHYASAEEILSKFYDICLLIEMASDPINTKDDNRATKIEKLIRVCDAKSSLDLWNADLNLFLKLWKETVEENCLAFSQSLTEGTSCSNKKGHRVTSKPKLKKESKETKPKGLACSDSASKPAAMKPEFSLNAKAKLGSPPPAKPLSRSNSTSNPKSNPIHGSLSQRTGKKLPIAIKPTFKSMAKALALDKPEFKLKAAHKRKNSKVSDSEEDFEVEAALLTVAEDLPSSPSHYQSQLCQHYSPVIQGEGTF
ncbi:DNA topoisomerase 2 [Massospora cicadina]|nr:DNA topoisomerase 2 [Massospora cicadina]